MPTKKSSQTAAYDVATWSLRDRQRRQTFHRDVSVAGTHVEEATPSPQFRFYVPNTEKDLQGAENSHLPPPPPPQPPASLPAPLQAPLPTPTPPSVLPPPTPPQPPLSLLPSPLPVAAASSPLPLLEADEELVRVAELYQSESDIPPHIAHHWDLANHHMWSDCIQLESDEES
ncbi:hypothetical protein CY34DRAFT_19206 [Suillus luteus UH-Slu-Lm8-n1]|uniref:Uncharacterized protein n=1 Tax=Suillus luteus UH-Slu-Lm8-n1 TaxID=930992 RepID=A0A0C9Z470_9AGAM|nr:hypothetical protein CY34DRAFT_19206 [Suillus luteus UH-Slu-Lm8-n1]